MEMSYRRKRFVKAKRVVKKAEYIPPVGNWVVGQFIQLDEGITLCCVSKIGGLSQRVADWMQFEGKQNAWLWLKKTPKPGFRVYHLGLILGKVLTPQPAKRKRPKAGQVTPS